MEQTIQSKLAIEIAQKSLTIATLEAQIEQLQAQNQDLLAQLDKATEPQTGKEVM